MLIPEIQITKSVVLNGKRPVYILGPCVMESEEFTWEMARALKVQADALNIPWVFKASYDKANRTSIKSYRGMGAEAGGRLLGSIGKELGVPVTTDVHTPEEADIIAPYVDILQIPAFLCRQTDLVVTAAQTGRAVNVKKGQFLSPWDVGQIAGKVHAAGNSRVFFTERGTTFGYQNLVVDMRSFYWIREAGFRVIFDATHSVQRPGGGGDRTTGDGHLAPVLARAAVAAGCDGVFMETHVDPSRALSDGPNQVPLADLPGVLKTLEGISAACSSTDIE